MTDEITYGLEDSGKFIFVLYLIISHLISLYLFILYLKFEMNFSEHLNHIIKIPHNSQS